MTDARFKRAERRVVEILGTRRTPLSGGNSAHTRSDTLHPDLYVEVKLAKRPPLWDQMHALRKRARRVGRAPLMLVTHPDDTLRLGLMDLEDLVGFSLDRDGSRILDLLDVFLVEHVPLRRSAWFSLFLETRAKAEVERKRPLVVYKASGRPGEVCGFELTSGWTVGGPYTTEQGYQHMYAPSHPMEILNLPHEGGTGRDRWGLRKFADGGSTGPHSRSSPWYSWWVSPRSLGSSSLDPCPT